MITARMENYGILRGNIFWAAPLDLGPQGIPEALRAAFGDLESTFGPSKTMPGPQKVENLENGIFLSVKILSVKNFVRENFVREKNCP